MTMHVETDIQDTEEVADAVRLASKGAIKVSCLRDQNQVQLVLMFQTGVYHAAIDDGEKERIHIQWRQGIVK